MTNYVHVLQAELKPNPAVWSRMHEDAKSLITALLARNPRERISARDALKHPFIVNHYVGAKRNSLNPPVQSLALVFILSSLIIFS
jgi:serine/threonine protein kinase